ncbi:MAG TPA: bifunctional tetrahydrofolate synthase/dihydrofolate synthase [Methylotenera sp.]|nr:bifunctional tetrahydrofolate synthase/dihydrofolate synthase [Methylotenera sp.]
MPKELVVKDLSAWLNYIESLHPKSIAMGLERIKLIISRLNLEPAFTIITVAGTNGKGSTCAMLENIYRQAGYQVGCYTSPHLLRYNERVRVNGSEVNDADLCKAFEAVDAARMDADDNAIALTYFEVGTLAAVWHFMQTKIDVAILEIGLGGRLDAVNAFEPDCAIVTSVDLDHLEFLGDTREKIGFEKAGVYRKAIPAICGDNNPPASLVSHAKQVQADLKCIHQDFDYSVIGNEWQYQSHGKVLHTLPIPALKGDYQLNNAACAITAVESLQSSLPVSTQAIADAMRQVTLAGRFQTVSNSPRVILDVAHNPHAARALAENLRAFSEPEANTIAVFAMLADKDIKGVVEAVKEQVDIWYIASIDNVRGASAMDLASVIAAVNPNAKYKIFDNAAIAYQQACIDAGENDKIVVFGSFFTVSNVMQALSDHSKN